MSTDIKICTLTHHTVPNYGAILQAYALQKTITKLGYESEILNYESNRVRINYYLKFPWSGSIKEKLKYLLFNFKYRKRNQMFQHFINSHLKLSEKSYTKKDLSTCQKSYDLFIVGSDQVWNLRIHNNDTTYMLDFLKENNKKGSFAASFGYSSIPDNYLETTVKLLSKFNYFNVRETSGKNILINEIGIKKDKINVVLDPTLLLKKSDWEIFITKNNQKYVLIYDLINSPKVKLAAKKISTEMNLKIIEIKTDSTTIGPEQFINLFYNADYVVTSSFHGMAFSTIFNKQFYYVLNENINNNNSRLNDLSSILNLDDRNVDNLLNEKHITNIDYQIVNEILKKYQLNSVNVLKEMIKNRKKDLFKDE